MVSCVVSLPFRIFTEITSFENSNSTSNKPIWGPWRFRFVILFTRFKLLSHVGRLHKTIKRTSRECQLPGWFKNSKTKARAIGLPDIRESRKLVSFPRPFFHVCSGHWHRSSGSPRRYSEIKTFEELKKFKTTSTRVNRVRVDRVSPSWQSRFG